MVSANRTTCSPSPLASPPAISACLGRLLDFPFGAYLQHRVAGRLPANRQILVGPPVSRYAFESWAVPTEIVHGEVDELIPLSIVEVMHVLTAFCCTSSPGRATSSTVGW